MSDLGSSRRPRRQRDLSNIPGFNHSRRSWTTGGMNITMETATYTSPGFSFRNTGDGFGGFNDFLQPQPRRAGTSRTSGGGGLLSGGLFGGAINLLNDVAGSQTRRERPARRVEYVTDSDESLSDVTDSDEDLAYGSYPPKPGTEQQPKSVVGKLKDRILHHGRHRQAERRERSPSPPRRPSESEVRRHRAEPIPEVTRPREQQRPNSIYDDTPDTSPERFTDVPLPSRDSYVPHSERDIAGQQRAVEAERREYLNAKHRFQQASQHSVIDPEHLQHLLNHVKLHGTLLASAQRKLQVAKEQQRQDEAARASRPRPQRRPSPPRQPVYQSEDEDDGFDSWSPRPFSGTSNRGGLFNEPAGHTGAFDPFAGFRVFDRMFSDMDSSFHTHGRADTFHFFAGQTGPQSKRTRFSHSGRSRRFNNDNNNTNTNTRFTNTTNTAAQPIPQMPSNPLLVSEATHLFKTYNNTWHTLTPTSSTIPYPTRTLRAHALADPSTIPHPLSITQTWSAEQTMQANTALFFLLAHNIPPVISNSATVSYDRDDADEEAVRVLVASLKKEKARWHSDRLGRRCGVEGGGVNEVLQRDERARAVFHGVCALVEFAVGREG
ncbi:hypothetical protein Q7P37_006521 [Cladosporium fusiforme]